MESNKKDLADRFREISDDEILARLISGDLNEVAQSVALSELAARGLPLPDPIGSPQESTRTEGDFEVVARYLNPIHAHIVRSCLEAAGVPAMLADDNLVRMLSIASVAVGGVRVMVPAPRAAEARQVIASFNRGDYSLPDNSELPTD